MPRHTRRAARRQRRRTRGRCAAAEDFYATLNNRWQHTARLPPTETRITQAYFIGRQINRELAAIIHEQKTGPIADLVASWRATEGQRIPEGLTPILMMMLNAADSTTISGAIGWLNRHGFDAPLTIYVQGDPRNHAICRVFIDVGTPGIGIPEYWTWTEYGKTRAAYRHYVGALADTLGLPVIRNGIAAEHEFCDILPAEERREKRLNMLTWSELRREYHRVDWTAMFVNYGIPEERLSGMMFNVTAPRFLLRFQSRIESWPIARWQGWLALIAAQRVAGISPHGPMRAAWFGFARRFLQGMVRDETTEELRMAVVRALLPNTLGRLWVRRHCSPDLRRRMIVMATNIRDAAIKAIRHTSWMAPSTRDAAVEKLRRMDIQMCWPERWEVSDVPCDGLNPAVFVENLLAITRQSTDESLKQLERGCRDPMPNGWQRSVYEVNAYYYPEENRFILPASILRPPFYDPSKSTVWNYGAIGATIGHELCHAFDSDGRNYDSRGDKHDWWTKRDDREYRNRADKVVKLYESRPYRGMRVNGKLTLVENIADLGGLEFALAGAAAELGRPLTTEELRDFFTSYAISWRSKDRHARARELLTIDPHAPPRLRVNHTVRQFDEWYEAFGVDPSCADYIPADKRIRFFR
jgi:putative endopeptidase